MVLKFKNHRSETDGMLIDFTFDHALLWLRSFDQILYDLPTTSRRLVELSSLKLDE